MALRNIYPFTYRAFSSEVGESALAIINHFKNSNPEFWCNALKRYSFRGYDYRRGEKVRLKFNEELSSCTDNDVLFDISNKILDWGGMDPLTSVMKQGLKKSLSCLNLLAREENVDLKELCVERLASITKVYEMWDLNNWVIYDSFCAKGLQWLISGLWNSLGYKKHENLLKLPWPPGRSCFPVSGFPRAADTAPNQKRLGFIYGSWFCKTIAGRLTDIDNKGFHWRPYHIEMIAFQLGHEIEH
jgi:hypothetical protein